MGDLRRRSISSSPNRQRSTRCAGKRRAQARLTDMSWSFRKHSKCSLCLRSGGQSVSLRNHQQDQWHQKAVVGVARAMRFAMGRRRRARVGLVRMTPVVFPGAEKRIEQEMAVSCRRGFVVVVLLVARGGLDWVSVNHEGVRTQKPTVPCLHVGIGERSIRMNLFIGCLNLRFSTALRGVLLPLPPKRGMTAIPLDWRAFPRLPRASHRSVRQHFHTIFTKKMVHSLPMQKPPK